MKAKKKKQGWFDSMQDARTFKVSVIGFNVEIFMIAYAGYITHWETTFHNDRVFTMKAPQEIYDGIATLKEEFIEIID